MGQTRLASLIETAVDLGLGMLIALVAQLFIFHLYGIKLPMHDNLVIVLYFTAISFVRRYAIRRLFNWWHYRK